MHSLPNKSFRICKERIGFSSWISLSHHTFYPIHVLITAIIFVNDTKLLKFPFRASVLVNYNFSMGCIPRFIRKKQCFLPAKFFISRITTFYRHALSPISFWNSLNSVVGSYFFFFFCLVLCTFLLICRIYLWQIFCYTFNVLRINDETTLAPLVHVAISLF